MTQAFVKHEETIGRVIDVTNLAQDALRIDQEGVLATLVLVPLICLPAFEAALLLASGEWRAADVLATLVVTIMLAVPVYGIWYGLTSRRLRTVVLGSLLALGLMSSAVSVVLLGPRSMAAYSPQA